MSDSLSREDIDAAIQSLRTGSFHVVLCPELVRAMARASEALGLSGRLVGEVVAMWANCDADTNWNVRERQIIHKVAEFWEEEREYESRS